MWPFKKKEPKQLKPAEAEYVLAKKAGRVDSVQTGVVVIEGKRYEGLKSTLVEPGRKVKEGQPIGKR